MMITTLGGALLNGDMSGTLTTASRLRNVQVSTTAPLVGTLTIAGGGNSMTTQAGLNGVQTAAADFFGAVFFQLSDPADIGKARVTWSWG